MKKFIFTLCLLGLCASGCVQVEHKAQKELHAHMRYLAKGDQIEVLSMTCNFEAYEDDFIAGFKRGFHELMTPADKLHVDYMGDYPGTYYINCGLGYAGLAVQDVCKKQKENPALAEVTGEIEF
ncbi:MAG: hypothetical protein QM715_03870 [Nibricoccus sp.]